MDTGTNPPPGASDALDRLDRAATHIIEARALLMALPADRRGDLGALTDALLFALGRRIAAELPSGALEGGAAAGGSVAAGGDHDPTMGAC